MTNQYFPNISFVSSANTNRRQKKMKKSARINVCTSYCNVSTMAIDLKNIFALFFRFLPSDEN